MQGTCTSRKFERTVRYDVGILCNAEWCIRKPLSPSTILYPITTITHNYHTNICPLLNRSWTRFEMGLFASVMCPVGPSVIINQLLGIIAERGKKVGFVPRQVVITAPLEAVLAIVIFEWFGKYFQSSDGGENSKYVNM